MRLGIGIFIVALATAALGQDAPIVRFVNGTPVKGEVTSVKPEGLEITNGEAGKVYPWSAFAAGTRFRFDPLYRANFSLAQQGKPMSRWTNAPESTTDSGSAPAAVQPMTFSAFPPLAARSRASLAGLELNDAARALTWGFRYGPGETEVAYVAIEPGGDDGLPTTLLLWSDPNQRAERLRGSRRAVGDEATVSFRKQRFRSTREGVDVQCDLALSVSTLAEGVFNVALDVELKKGDAVSSFTLYGPPPGMLVGDGDIVAQDLLVSPLMKLAISAGSLSGDIRMGRLRFIPRSGMDKAVSVVISDARNNAVMEEKVLFQDGKQAEIATLALPLKSLVTGQRYSMQSGIDLGPFFGALRYGETFVAP